VDCGVIRICRRDFDEVSREGLMPFEVFMVYDSPLYKSATTA
jgi:hypothetical protein